ncbi:lantibiotic dehydratase C-terminal domain-containing protein [Streptacidiphilus sp. P02-A3a]|uniref:lantibiotic dehydratase C-terminal domain-containing protein n=1 Tax=Streptacidiphilus sp. P02-A3a TaxID=2704468 RepID=UPI0015FC9728|nr:lantibiotic dehydratase C-terminal domain-containing protein [Streptacidiphilus sp. P02-A3a]QMU70600.1 hypothetical protein GXP74_22755 [Streptacidiphilus sp. P02-A3a]
MLDQQPAQHWVSAHVFTAHPLDLVVGRLLPDVLAGLRESELADRAFFIRHWQSGPHLRLRIRLTTPDAAPLVREAVADHTAAFFEPLTPATPMTADQYHELASRFAALEPGSQVGSLAPNDSLAFVDYRPEHAKYGRGAALRAVEECFAVCSEISMAAVVAGWDQPRRLAHCFALLAGALDPSGGRATEQHSKVVGQYQRSRASWLPVARAARTACDASATGGTSPDTDPLVRWFAAFRRARRLAADPQRLPGHLTHLACNRLGVRLDQEAALRGLAALAVDELTSPEGVLDEAAGRS